MATLWGRGAALKVPSEPDGEVTSDQQQLLGPGGFEYELKAQSNSPLGLFFLGREGGREKKIRFPLPANLQRLRTVASNSCPPGEATVYKGNVISPNRALGSHASFCTTNRNVKPQTFSSGLRVCRERAARHSG